MSKSFNSLRAASSERLDLFHSSSSLFSSAFYGFYTIAMVPPFVIVNAFNVLLDYSPTILLYFTIAIGGPKSNSSSMLKSSSSNPSYSFVNLPDADESSFFNYLFMVFIVLSELSYYKLTIYESLLCSSPLLLSPVLADPLLIFSL